MERSTVALPEDSYLARIGEIAYAASSAEWTVLGDLNRLAKDLPENLRLDLLEPLMTAGIAKELKTSAASMADGPIREYIVAVYRGLFVIAEIRSDVLHARPATHPSGLQRLLRAETQNRATTGRRFWIDDEWMDISIRRMNHVTTEIHRIRPPLA
ncbi:hypothetical protein [Pseudarthrobacter phenanthrenivorans]|uniref:hypothetical protein n=1 Tax=Pseudarthrobacter phenanthrenivorans TaxID=361575 RepID=UPI002F35DBEC